MVNCYNVRPMFAQISSDVSFASDLDGKVQYASFGGDVDNRQSVEVEPQSEFGIKLYQIAVWVLAMFAQKHDAKNTLNRLLEGFVPLIKASLARQYVYSELSINNLLVDIWMILSGNNVKAKTYSPDKGDFSTWLDYRCRGEKTRILRGKYRRNLCGLDSILRGLEGSEELESIGSRSLFGLSFEPSDPDQIDNKWVKMSKKEDPTVDRVARKEESAGLRKVLRKLPADNAKCLSLYFVKGLTLREIAIEMDMSAMGVQKKIKRTLNVIRQHYGIEGAVVSLGGKNRMVKMLDVDLEVQ